MTSIGTSPQANPRIVDLRSDTVTRPTPGMRRAMADAEVGDAVYGEDPTVARLEAHVAALFGHEAAMFVPSGTMATQVALAALTIPGDAIFCDARAHIARWEGGGAAANAGAQLVQVPSDDGLPTVADLDAYAMPDHPKAPRPAVLSIENTHNAAGGVPHDPRSVSERARWAADHGMSVHIDGARIFNAAIASQCDVSEYGAEADAISVCCSKGLGAPVGSLLVGSRALMARADRVRHRLGGGWRQAGILAAAALYALEHHLERLADDHARAAALADGLEATGIVRVTHAVRTNLVCFDVAPTWGTARAFCDRVGAQGVLISPTGAASCRLVTHLDVDDDAVAHAITVFGGLG